MVRFELCLTTHQDLVFRVETNMALRPSNLQLRRITNKNETLTIGASQINTVFDTPYTVNEEGLQEANNLIVALKKIAGLPATEAADTQ